MIEFECDFLGGLFYKKKENFKQHNTFETKPRKKSMRALLKEDRLRYGNNSSVRSVQAEA